MANETEPAATLHVARVILDGKDPVEFTAATPHALNTAIAAWCRDYWKDRRRYGPDDFPATAPQDDAEAISIYFHELDGESLESAVVDLEPLPDTSALSEEQLGAAYASVDALALAVIEQRAAIGRTRRRKPWDGRGKRPGHPQRHQASHSMTATPPSRSLADRDGAPRRAPTSASGKPAATAIASRHITPKALSEDTPAQMAGADPQRASFELNGPLSCGLLVYPPDRARPYWRDDHGHRYVLDQVLAGEPDAQRERMLRSHAHAIFEVASALASARLESQHPQVLTLAHAASRLCHEVASQVGPDYWRPGR